MPKAKPTIATADWKQYPNRPGRQRFQAYFTKVDVVEIEERVVREMGWATLVPATNTDAAIQELQPRDVTREFCQVRAGGKLQWIAKRELHNMVYIDDVTAAAKKS